MTILPFIQYKNFDYYNLSNTIRTEIIIISSEDTILIRHQKNSLNEYQWISLEHGWCGGTIEIQDVKKYKVLYCKHCGFRETFPLYINTEAQLKKYFYKENEENKIKNRSEILDL